MFSQLARINIAFFTATFLGFAHPPTSFSADPVSPPTIQIRPRLAPAADKSSPTLRELYPTKGIPTSREPYALASGPTLQSGPILPPITGTPLHGDLPGASSNWANPRDWGFLRPQLFALRGQTPPPAVVRVIAEERNGTSNGSGTLVDVRGDYGLVVTNWHVIRDATGEITVTFPDGFRSPARVQKTDRDWDLAALFILRPNAPPIKISQRAPQQGEPLVIAGYGKGDFRIQSGKCVQYVSPGAKHPYEMVEVSAQARQGDSGGPILNQAGELAGVLFGAGGGTTSGSYCGRVRWFLESVWPNLGSETPQIQYPGQSDATVGSLVSAGRIGPRLPKVDSAELVEIARPDRATDVDDVDESATQRSGTPSRRMIPYYSAPPDRYDEVDRVRRQRTSPGNSISLLDIVGDTTIEQGKLLLAIIGVLAIVSKLVGGMSAE